MALPKHYQTVLGAITKAADKMDEKQISYLANEDDCKGTRHSLTMAVCRALADAEPQKPEQPASRPRTPDCKRFPVRDHPTY